LAISSKSWFYFFGGRSLKSSDVTVPTDIYNSRNLCLGLDVMHYTYTPASTTVEIYASA
jgi:hypothetical protein